MALVGYMYIVLRVWAFAGPGEITDGCDSWFLNLTHNGWESGRDDSEPSWVVLIGG